MGEDRGGRKTSVYRRDFLSRLDTLEVRIRFKLERLKQGQEGDETADQLTWVLQEFDNIRSRYLKKLPWPSGAFSWVLEDSWPKASALREDLLRLEKEYYSQITKPPRE